jgi:hypothetical protein
VYGAVIDRFGDRLLGQRNGRPTGRVGPPLQRSRVAADRRAAFSFVVVNRWVIITALVLALCVAMLRCTMIVTAGAPPV